MTHLGEKILCIARSRLPRQWLGERVALNITAADVFVYINDASVCWRERQSAETDSTTKQLIPYVVLQSVDAGLTACYQRSGGEKRLHRLWSIGIGGHINPADGTGADSVAQVVGQGLAREIAEETGLDVRANPPVLAGVINEEITAVGHVHLGLVYRLPVERPEQVRPSAELTGFQWIDTREVRALALEHWSRLALALIAAPGDAVKP